MKWYTHLKGKRTISVFCAAAVLFVALFVAAAVPVSAENIDETNPEFTKIDINGSNGLEAQGSTGLYTCTGSLEQGDGKYTLRSNGFVVWGTEDDVTFAYRQYNTNVYFSSSTFYKKYASIETHL